MAQRGRPTEYREEYPKQAEKLCKLGATNADLADFFGVAVRTIDRWIGEYPDFCRAVKATKGAADERVTRSLYQRAMGYTFDSVKIFLPKGARKPVLVPYREHVPPDPTSMIFWLKNRQPAEWRDKQEVSHGVTEEMAEVMTRIRAARSDG